MLKNLTTTHVGGPAQQLVTATSEAELAQAVAAADTAGHDVLLIGGGSNLVISDEGYPGVAVQIATRGLHLDEQPNGKVLLRAAAGENWDTTVEYSLGPRKRRRCRP